MTADVLRRAKVRSAYAPLERPAVIWNQMAADKPLGISNLAQLCAPNRYALGRPLS
jgi:hypothetical protein